MSINNSKKPLNESKEVAKILLAREQVEIDKVVKTTGSVTVTTSTDFRDEVIHLDLQEVSYQEKRVPIGREVPAIPQIRQEGQTTIIPVIREEAVVVKRLILVEEIHLTQEVSSQSSSQTIRLREQRAGITRE